jgi:O-antigen/teichoic acid export membrane protein
MAGRFQYTLTDSFKRYSKNTGWIFSERILRIIILIPVTALLARYLGPEKIGTYNLAISLVAIFAIITPLGIPSLLIREIVREEERSNELVTTTLVLRLVAAFVFYGLLIAATSLLQYSRLELTLVSIIGIRLVFQSFETVDNFLQASVKLRTSSKIRFIALIIVSALKLYLIFTEAPLIHFAWAYITEFGIMAILFAWMYGRMHGYRYRLQFKAGTALFLLKSSLPLIYATALMTVNMKIDQVMITKLLDNEANGYYSVVVALIETLYFIPVALGTSLFPGLIKQHAVKSDDYLRSFQLLYEILLIIAIGIAVAFNLLAPFVIHLLYGPAYEPSVFILRVYSLSPLLMYYGFIRSRWLIIEDLHKYSVIFLIGALVVNIALNLVLIPACGVIGAVYSLLASYLTAFILIPFLIRPTRISVYMLFRSFRFRELRRIMRERRI